MKEFIRQNSLSLSVLWAVLILILCAMPGRYLPSAGWLELLSVDKLVHAAMFYILGHLVIQASVMRGMSLSIVYTLLFAAVVYGFLLEIGQSRLFSGRSMDFFDFVANTAGVIIAALFGRRLIRAERRRVSSGDSQA